ncbi:MAG: AI-2E family transporter, partial [Clostridia bacterium]|nr:AI-2E family transporter [Clostridia bacterium]
MKEPYGDQRSRLRSGLRARSAAFAAAALLCFFAVPVLFSLFRPFFFAVLVAAMLTPVVSGMSRFLHIAKKPIALLTIVLLVASLFGLLGWLLQAILGESVLLATNIQTIWNAALTALEPHRGKFEWLAGFFSGEADEVFDAIIQSVATWFQNTGRSVANTMLFNSRTIADKIGVTAAGTVICMIAAYYITIDRHVIRETLRTGLGERMYRVVRTLKNTVSIAVVGYLRAQLLLALFAFIVVLLPLLVYGQPYALLISLFLAFLDLIPIVGTSLILIPWGVLEL